MWCYLRFRAYFVSIAGLFGFLEIVLNWQWDKPFDAPIQNARCRLSCSCPDDVIGTWMDLDNSAQRPLHWGHVVLSEDDDCAFLNAVSTLAPFVAGDQLVQILLMPTVPKMLFELLDMLPSGRSLKFRSRKLISESPMRKCREWRTKEMRTKRSFWVG